MSLSFAEQLQQHRALFEGLDGIAQQVRQAAGLIAECLRNDGKVMFCGNGGSAADSQHMAAEFIGRFLHDRRPLAAMVLASDSAQLTGIGNDFDFEQVFERPLRALGRPGDVLVAISTSGRSPNVLRAAQAARELGILVIGLLGHDGGLVAGLCDVPIIAQSDVTARIQEAHCFVGHALCAEVETCLGC